MGPSVQSSGVRGRARPDLVGALASPSGQTLSRSPRSPTRGPERPPHSCVDLAWRSAAPSGEAARSPPACRAASWRLARATRAPGVRSRWPWAGERHRLALGGEAGAQAAGRGAAPARGPLEAALALHLCFSPPGTLRPRAPHRQATPWALPRPPVCAGSTTRRSASRSWSTRGGRGQDVRARRTDAERREKAAARPAEGLSPTSCP